MGNRFKFIILACLALSAISIFYLLRPKAPSQPEVVKYPAPEAKANLKVQSMVSSPDGKWILTVKEDKSKDSVSFRFEITGPDISRKEIFSKLLPVGSTLSIPANTFSPDDKYFFLKETGANGTSYLVFTTSGEPIAEDVQNFEFAGMFAQKHENYKITDATGWGGVNLIVFNTDKAAGGAGPSFWFEVPSTAFIQLSNRFN